MAFVFNRFYPHGVAVNPSVLGEGGKVFPSEPKKWALFDLDWTLIRPTTTPCRPTLSGGPFCQQPDDWAVIPGRIERLQDFVREGWSVGIISNQKFANKSVVVARMINVFNLFNKYLPDIILMVATDESRVDPTNPLTEYRKPGVGWGFYLPFVVTNGRKEGLFCGDAVQDISRPDRSWGYADSDRQFAINMGIAFFTPEEIFPQIKLPEALFTMPKLLLLLVGPPGSGKSTFAKRLGQVGWALIESDVYKSNWSRMQKEIHNQLMQGRRVVVDATHPGKARRLEVIAIATQYQVPVGIILFLNPGKWNRAEGRKPIPQIAYNRYWANFEEPNEAVVYYQT